jgi:hypothetical protein
LENAMRFTSLGRTPDHATEIAAPGRARLYLRERSIGIMVHQTSR